MSGFDRSRLPELAADFEKRTRATQLSHKYKLASRGLLKYLVEARRLGLVGNKAFSRLRFGRTEHDFPAGRDARFRTILRCVNTELKQAVVLGLDRLPRTYVEIGAALAAMTGVKLPASQSYSAYCTKTFLPAGLVVQEHLGRGLGITHRYFALTKSGDKYGRAIAAYSLRYAVDHEISLYQLLGQVHSPGESDSPYNRSKIIELVTQGHTRIVDLTTLLSLTIEDVRQHLNRLRSLGVLTFDTLNFEQKGVKPYTWAPGRTPSEARVVGELKTLTKNVAHWLYLNKVGDRNQIARALNYEDPTHVSTVLAGLSRQRLASTPFSSTDKSRITLLRKASLITDYTRAVRAALQDKPELRAMRMMLREFISDKERFRRYLDVGIELYRNVSPDLNSRTPQERESQLLQFVERYRTAQGTGPRPVDIVRELGWTHGAVTMYLRFLVKKGLLKKERKGPAVRYGVS